MARVNSYYLDRLGKLERFRRQIYAVTLTRQSEDLWLGLATVIEWAKDLGEKAESGLPAFARDTTSIYLVASRDGIHLDDDFIYARRPLIPKGKVQGHWRSGFLLAADQIVSDHEQRDLKRSRSMADVAQGDVVVDYSEEPSGKLVRRDSVNYAAADGAKAGQGA